MSNDKFLTLSGLRHVISDLKSYLDGKEYIISSALNDLDSRLIDQSLGIQYDTTAGWNSKTGYIPKKGALIIYSDYTTVDRNGRTLLVPGIKIGSGNAYVQDLAFIDEALAKKLVNHINNNIMHTNADEKSFWNNKINVDDSAEVVNESLIFNRN